MPFVCAVTLSAVAMKLKSRYRLKITNGKIDNPFRVLDCFTICIICSGTIQAGDLFWETQHTQYVAAVVAKKCTLVEEYANNVTTFI